MFYDTKQFPFCQLLESHWQTIRDEYQTIDPDHLLEAPWEDIYNKSWEIYTLVAKQRAFKLHCQRLPETAALLEQVPHLYNAGFSVLGPGTHIKPHVGYTTDVLRYHLGLIVPDNCAIRVGDETYAWKEGESMIFDDMVEHEAWNKSDQLRVILILDILKAAVS